MRKNLRRWKKEQYGEGLKEIKEDEEGRKESFRQMNKTKKREGIKIDRRKEKGILFKKKEGKKVWKDENV